jgi:hypothetical protein
MISFNRQALSPSYFTQFCTDVAAYQSVRILRSGNTKRGTGTVWCLKLVPLAPNLQGKIYNRLKDFSLRSK